MKVFRISVFFIVFAALMLTVAACTAPSPKWNSADDVTGSRFDTGLFSVLIPDGWSGVAVSDTFDEYDGDTDPSQVYIAKGNNIKNEIAVYSKPYILVEFTPAAETFYEPSSMFYDNVEEQTVSIGGREWKGFSGHFVNDCIVLWTELEDGSHAQFTIYHKDQVSVQDPDIQAMLMSIGH